MSLRVKYVDVPQGAQEAATVDAQGQPFSDVQLVASGATDIAYATLEPEGWPLDGSRRIMPSDVVTGFWSPTPSNAASTVLGKAILGHSVLGAYDSEARFNAPPVITVLLDGKYTATGITITFSPSTEEWCPEVCVEWYDGDTIKAQEIAYPSEARWVVPRMIEGFDKVTVVLRKTNHAGHFAKVQKIEIGQTTVFEQDEITSVHIVNEVDPSLSELTVDTMKIDVHDRKARSLFPQEKQRMDLYKNGKLYASQYISGSSRQSKQYYSFSCQSAIGLLDGDYMGGIYNNPIEDVLDDILKGFLYDLDDSFSGCNITGYLPICTRREALQQVVFAIGAVVTTQSSSTIKIAPLPEDETRFERSDIFQGGKVETEPRIAKVEVLAHKYSKTTETETLLENEVISGSDVLVTFNEPHHYYSITGGTITGSGANWVTITASGEVTLTGRKYLHSTVRRSWKNAEATVSERNNELIVEEATLVHSGNVADVLKRLRTICQYRQTLTQEVAVSDEKQRAGIKAVSVNPWGETLKGYITSMESDLTPNGHTASVTILGTSGERVADARYSGDMEGSC